MSSPRARSRNSARAVRKMIGMSAVSLFSSSASATPQPSRPGIITSRRITSGMPEAAASSPEGPSLASSTDIPSASRLTRQSSRIGASSSMTRTFVMNRRSVYPQQSCLTLRGAELEHERRAATLVGVDPDPPAHCRDEALREEEPQACLPRADRAGGRVAAVELAEDPLLLGVRDPDTLVLNADLDGVLAAARGDRDRAAGGGVANRVVEEVGEHLAELFAVGRSRERLVGERDDEAMAVRVVARVERADGLADDRPDIGLRELHGHVARVELGDGEKPVDDRRQPLGLRGDVAQEGRTLLLSEEYVLAQERLGEAVDRRQRRSQLVRDGGDEVRLHLLDAALRRDVAKRVDAAGDRARRIYAFRDISAERDRKSTR